jgi:heme-degrading monooxygenase HmoA
MSVLVTIWMRGDAKKFEQIAADDPNRMRSIAGRGKEHGAIAHRIYATDDGDVMVIDEWPDAESFNRFFETMQSEIGPLMQEAGVTDEPAVRFWRKLETGDDIGWGAE